MGLINSVMIQYTPFDIEEAKKQHELAKNFMANCFTNSPFHVSLKETIKMDGTNTEDVFEVYNDWNEFIERIKEIG